MSDLIDKKKDETIWLVHCRIFWFNPHSKQMHFRALVAVRTHTSVGVAPAEAGRGFRHCNGPVTRMSGIGWHVPRCHTDSMAPS